jgi:ABC-type sugar transport system permease subunit
MATLHPTRSGSILPGNVRTGQTARTGRVNKFLPLWLLLPTILVLLAVQIYPTLYSFYLSLNQTRGGELIFVGLDNFQRMFRDIEFGRSLSRTFVYAGWYLVLTIGLGLLLAVLLNRRVRFTGFYLILLFIPWVISDVVAGTIWRWMFQQSYGILQFWLGFLSERSLFVNPNGAMAIVVVASVWRSLAFTIILFLGALQTIPGEVLESAALDGASGWQSFWRITFPLIRPTFLVAILLTSIRGINALGMILSILGRTGGSGNAAQTTALYMLNAVQRDGDFGLAASSSVILFVINIILTFVYLRFITRKGEAV